LASFEGHVEVAHVLLEYGADANAMDHIGSTPLQLASPMKHGEIIRVLGHGADTTD
jgi:ankyrin repeat protein